MSASLEISTWLFKTHNTFAKTGEKKMASLLVFGELKYLGEKIYLRGKNYRFTHFFLLLNLLWNIKPNIIIFFNVYSLFQTSNSAEVRNFTQTEISTSNTSFFTWSNQRVPILPSHLKTTKGLTLLVYSVFNFLFLPEQAFQIWWLNFRLGFLVSLPPPYK